MAQFKFYISSNERKQLVSYLLECDAYLIPAKILPSKSLIKLKDLNEFDELLERKIIGFYILHNDYSYLPFEFGELGESKYIIHQKIGGPYIDINFYLGYSEDAIFPYKFTVIDHYSKFINPFSNKEFVVPDELVAFYKLIIKYIKSICQSIRYNNKIIWVGHEVIQEMTNDGRLNQMD